MRIENFEESLPKIFAHIGFAPPGRFAACPKPSTQDRPSIQIRSRLRKSSEGFDTHWRGLWRMAGDRLTCSGWRIGPASWSPSHQSRLLHRPLR